MATKKTATKSPSKSGAGPAKKNVGGKSSAASARPTPKTKQAKAEKFKQGAKVKAAPAKGASVKPAKTVAVKPAKAAPGKAGKPVPPAQAPAPVNGKGAVPVPPFKKKPPSITITRPEVTRPPVILPPPRPLEAPIGAPSILVPKDGLATSSLTPMLRWMYVGGATQYEVEWSADAHFGRGRGMSIVAQQTAITLDPSNQLKPSTNYKWRVRGGNDAGWGPWSHPESFRSPEK